MLNLHNRVNPTDFHYDKKNEARVAPKELCTGLPIEVYKISALSLITPQTQDNRAPRGCWGQQPREIREVLQQASIACFQTRQTRSRQSGFAVILNPMSSCDVSWLPTAAAAADPQQVDHTKLNPNFFIQV